MKYRPEIDGLRTVAVVPVILFHAGVPLFSGGYVGVDVFFVISGYLISSILINEISQGRFSIWRFYERRARRILPALFTVMAVTVPLSYLVLLPNEFISYGKSLVAVPTFLSNLLFWSERGYFGAASELKPLVHTWSLAVEEQFYIFFPPILLFLASRTQALSRILFILTFSLSLIASWYLTKLHFETGFYLPVSRVWEFLVGVSCAVWLRQNNLLSGALGYTSTSIGTGLLVYAVLMFDSETLFPGLAALVPVIGTALIIISHPAQNPVMKILSSRVFVGFGLISYALYLWHQPVFAYLRLLGYESAVVLCASLPVIFLLSYLSYRYIETPVRRSKSLSPYRLFTTTIVAGSLFILLGSVIVANRGFVDRYAPEDVATMRSFERLRDFSENAYNSAQFRPFDNSGRTKVVLSGDSHARDLFNLIREAGFEKTHQFTTKRINADCGNLFTEEDLTPHIAPRYHERCRIMGRLDHPTLHQLLLEADEVWLSALWFKWVIDRLPQTIAKLEDTYDLKVLVFGPKHFGPMSLREAISVPIDSRHTYRQPVASHFIDVNQHFIATVPSEYIVELLAPLCGGDVQSCQVFDDKGVPVTTDGGHLSPTGATYLAPILRDLLSKRP